MRQLPSAASTSLVDVLDCVLDKGIVIDAHIAVKVLGIRLIEVDTVVIVSSLPRYVRLSCPPAPDPVTSGTRAAATARLASPPGVAPRLSPDGRAAALLVHTGMHLPSRRAVRV
jgi:hypothetical protein